MGLKLLVGSKSQFEVIRYPSVRVFAVKWRAKRVRYKWHTPFGDCTTSKLADSKSLLSVDFTTERYLVKYSGILVKYYQFMKMPQLW